jgi:hypothetical protein
MHPRLTLTDATLGRHDMLAITLRGKIEDPRALTGIDLALTADGDAAAIFGGGTATAPLPLAFSGHVVANGGAAERGWKLADFKGTVGRSDLTGQASLSYAGARKNFEARFESQWIDAARFNDGAADSDPLGADGRLMPDEKIPMALFEGSDGHVQWKIGKAGLHNLAMAGLSADLSWRDGKAVGVWTIDAVGGGKADGKLALDAKAQPSSLGVEANFTHLALGDSLRELGMTDAFQGGRTDLRFKAAGSGDNWRGVLATAQGSLMLSIGPTRIASRLAQEGLGGILRHWETDVAEDRVELRCLIQQSTLSEGLLRSETLLFALPNVVASGQGSLNLTHEGLDFTLTPRPPVSGIGPLDIGGTLAHPIVAEDRSAIVRNLPVSAGDAAIGLQAFAGNDGNACFVALAQARKRPVTSGTR